MHRKHLKVLFLAACAALASCSDDEKAATDAGAADAPASDAPAAQTLNGCADTDYVAVAGNTINFGGTTLGNTYSPKCLKVTPGTTVTFTGNFATHPLSPGSSPSTPAAGSPGNPITAVSAGTTPKTFTFAAAGNYPYFCTAHLAGGMWGAIKVAN